MAVNTSKEMKIPATPPRFDALVESVFSGERRRVVIDLIGDIGTTSDGKYRHWDTIRRMKPPHGLQIEEWWFLIKMARNSMRREVPLRDKAERLFHYTLPDPVLEMLHRIDRDASGKIELPERAMNPETRDRYIVNSLIEEAITSSQLEGAATTREVAKEMIRAGRRPRDESEQMIMNNFRAMQQIRQFVGEPLSTQKVLDIHRVLTHNLLNAKRKAFRQPGDGVGVYSGTGELLHKPPPAEEIEERLARMCAFANEDETETDYFLHPVLKAIILHFWLAYDHPFVDGNGRTARALFYWFMLSRGFWLFDYVSISTILKKAPAKYGRSFLYTETDESDLTYFLLAQVQVIGQAIDELHQYLQRKISQMQETEALLRPSAALNYRQIALLSHALRHPGQQYTIASHQQSHDVAYQTARTDLLDLEEKGLLLKRKISKTFVFKPEVDLAERLTQLS